MPTEMIAPDDRLRALIRMYRKERAGLSQREAAERAGLSAVWWRQIEGGIQPNVQAGTLARMCYAIDIPPLQVSRVGYDHLAELISERYAAFGGQEYADPAERHLWLTPETSDTERRALIAYLRTLREAEGSHADRAAARQDRMTGELTRTMRGGRRRK